MLCSPQSSEFEAARTDPKRSRVWGPEISERRPPSCMACSGFSGFAADIMHPVMLSCVFLALCSFPHRNHEGSCPIARGQEADQPSVLRTRTGILAKCAAMASGTSSRKRPLEAGLYIYIYIYIYLYIFILTLERSERNSVPLRRMPTFARWWSVKSRQGLQLGLAAGAVHGLLSEGCLV